MTSLTNSLKSSHRSHRSKTVSEKELPSFAASRASNIARGRDDMFGKAVKKYPFNDKISSRKLSVSYEDSKKDLPTKRLADINSLSYVTAPETLDHILTESAHVPGKYATRQSKISSEHLRYQVRQWLVKRGLKSNLRNEYHREPSNSTDSQSMVSALSNLDFKDDTPSQRPAPSSTVSPWTSPALSTKEQLPSPSWRSQRAFDSDESDNEQFYDPIDDGDLMSPSAVSPTSYTSLKPTLEPRLSSKCIGTSTSGKSFLDETRKRQASTACLKTSNVRSSVPKSKSGPATSFSHYPSTSSGVRAANNSYRATKPTSRTIPTTYHRQSSRYDAIPVSSKFTSSFHSKSEPSSQSSRLIDILQTQMAELTRSNEEYHRRIDTLQTHITALQSKCHNIQQKYDSDVSRYEATIEKLRSDIKNVQLQSEIRERDLRKRFRARIRDLEFELYKANMNVKSHDQKLAQVSEQWMDDKRGWLEKHQKQRDERLASMVADLNVLKSVIQKHKRAQGEKDKVIKMHDLEKKKTELAKQHLRNLIERYQSTT